MNIRLLSLLTLLIFSCSETQKELPLDQLVKRNGLMYEVNKEKPFTGNVFVKFKNQQYALRGSFDEGLKTGEWTQYFENGQINRRSSYKDSLLSGLSESYTEKGQLTLKQNYIDGELDGLEEQYFENGDVKSKIEYGKGQLNGLHESYAENGQLVIKATYLENRKNGRYISYYPNGNPDIIADYQNDNQVGEYIEHWSNGNKKKLYNRTEEGTFIKDNILYNEDGSVQKHTFIPPSGKTINKGKWKKYWTSDWNVVTAPAEYMSTVGFNDKGRPNTAVTYFYRNGNVYSEGSYSSIEPDIRDGGFKSYYPDGSIKTKLTYKNNKKHGVCESYYAQNNLSKKSRLLERVHYRNGQLHGAYELWNGSYESDLPFLVSYQVAQMGGYKNGVGSKKWWKLEGNPVNGKFDGTFKLWWRYPTNRRAEPYNMPAYTPHNWSKGRLTFNGYNSRKGGLDYYDSKGNLLSPQERSRMLDRM